MFVSRQRRADALANLAGLSHAAQAFGSARDYFLHLNAAEQRQRELRSTASLVLAHIGHVKGLEFEHVLIPYLEQGAFPDPQAPIAQEKNTSTSGMTRARQQLTLLAHSPAAQRVCGATGLCRIHTGRQGSGLMAQWRPSAALPHSHTTFPKRSPCATV